MLQAARSAKKKLLYVRFVQIKSDPENTIPTIAFGIEGLSNFWSFRKNLAHQLRFQL